MLRDVTAALPTNYRGTCLCTCGGFLQFDWPPEIPDNGNCHPGPNEIRVLTDAAERAVRGVLTEDIASQLQGHWDYLTLGVDTRNDATDTHAEMVCLVNIGDATVHWTGKFYPTTGQEQHLVGSPISTATSSS